jgi:hypothetical protein
MTNPKSGAAAQNEGAVADGPLESRVREIVKEEIAKLTIAIQASCNGYGDTIYVSAALSHDGSRISDSDTAFRP